MVRRTITIEDMLHKDVNQFRSICLAQNMEVDYTCAVNILAKLGAKRIFSGKIEENEWEVVFQYLKNQQLQDDAAVDQTQDGFVRRFPKFLELYRVKKEV